MGSAIETCTEWVVSIAPCAQDHCKFTSGFTVFILNRFILKRWHLISTSILPNYYWINSLSIISSLPRKTKTERWSAPSGGVRPRGTLPNQAGAQEHPQGLKRQWWCWNKSAGATTEEKTAYSVSKRGCTKRRNKSERANEGVQARDRVMITQSSWQWDQSEKEPGTL